MVSFSTNWERVLSNGRCIGSPGRVSSTTVGDSGVAAWDGVGAYPLSNPRLTDNQITVFITFFKLTTIDL